MKNRGELWISLLLAASLLLICSSARQCVKLPLPIAVLIGLGTPAVLLLLRHRQKLADILGSSAQ